MASELELFTQYRARYLAFINAGQNDDYQPKIVSKGKEFETYYDRKSSFPQTAAKDLFLSLT